MATLHDKSTVGAIIVAYVDGKDDFKRNPNFNYQTRQFVEDDLQEAYEIGFRCAIQMRENGEGNA